MAVDERNLSAEHLRRLITDPLLAATSREVRAEIAAMPAPEALVEAIRQAG